MATPTEAAAGAGRFEGLEGGLRGAVARGTLINAAFNIGLDTLNLLKGFLVAALLVPAEYGIWGILVVALGTLALLKEVGIADKYIQQDEPDQERAFQRAFTLEAAVNGLLAVVVLAALPVVVLAYGRTELLAPGLVLVLAIPAVTLQSPLWVFYRRMEFMRQRRLQAVDPVVSFVVTIALAALGLGYWSLVIGLVAGRFAGAAAALRAAPYRPRWVFERDALRDYWRFSWPLFVTSGARVLAVQLLILAGNHELGLAGVGALALASTISLYAARVDAVVTQTIYPAVCAARDRTDVLFEAFAKSNRLGLMWGVPFGVGLGLFAADLVEFGIGEEWSHATGLIQAFGLIAAVNHVGFNWTAFFRARGETRPIAVVAVVSGLATILVTIPLLSAYDLDGVIAGFAIATAVALAGRVWYLTRLFPAFQILVHSARAAAPTVPAVALVLAARMAIDADRSLSLAFAELALFAVVTAVATMLIERPLIREVRTYLSRPAAV